MFKMSKTIELRYMYIVALTHNSYLAIVLFSRPSTGFSSSFGINHIYPSLDAPGIRLSEYNHAETIFRRDR